MSHRIAAKITGLPAMCLQGADQRGPRKMVETNDEWIRTRTGIRERHIAETGRRVHTGYRSGKDAVGQDKTDPSEIDLIIVASVTPDMFFPATACLVQDRLGAKRAWGLIFPRRAPACLCTDGRGAIRGFRSAPESGSDRQRCDELDFGLQRSLYLCIVWRWRGRRAAGASEGRRRHFGFFARHRRSGGQYLYMPGGGSLHPPRTKRSTKHACSTSGRFASVQVCRAPYGGVGGVPSGTHGFTSDDLALVVPHQANLRIIRAMQQRLGVTTPR